MIKHVAIYARPTGTQAELLPDLRQTLQHRGATIVAAYIDNGNLTGRGKYAEWRKVLAHLDAVDQIVVSNVGDFPGKTVADLLKTLATFRDHGVTLYLNMEDIETGSGGFAVLDLIRAYRRAKLSQAIRARQAKALAAGKRIGRPTVARTLAEGGGIRSTARMCNVSPASVIKIRRSSIAS